MVSSLQLIQASSANNMIPIFMAFKSRYRFIYCKLLLYTFLHLLIAPHNCYHRFSHRNHKPGRIDHNKDCATPSRCIQIPVHHHPDSFQAPERKHIRIFFSCDRMKFLTKIHSARKRLEGAGKIMGRQSAVGSQLSAVVNRKSVIAIHLSAVNSQPSMGRRH